MAEAVESALSEKRHLIVEAGTGTGKTLAYLVPAILSGQRVVISTGTKNLQEQLFFKDIPFLQQHFPSPIPVCYMKGRANYACRQKIYDAEKEPVLTGLEEVADFQIIRDWELHTKTGDRAEIKTLPENSSAWAKIDARRELCTGQKCPQFDRCFLTEMHRRAMVSDIIIVNHHLFFADLAVREDARGGGILPEYNAVIFDEAHEMEEVAGQYFGSGVSSYQFQELARDVMSLARRKQFDSLEIDRTTGSLLEHADQLFAALAIAEGRNGYTGQNAFLEKHDGKYFDVLRSLELVAATLKAVDKAPEEAIPLVRRAEELSARLHFWMESNDKKFVYWTERR